MRGVSDEGFDTSDSRLSVASMMEKVNTATGMEAMPRKRSRVGECTEAERERGDVLMAVRPAL